MRYREHTDDYERIGRNTMPSLCGSKEKMKIGHTEFVVVLGPYIGEGHFCVSMGRLKAIPVEGTDFPIKNLKFTWLS